MNTKERAKSIILLYDSIRDTSNKITKWLECVWEGNWFINFEEIHINLKPLIVDVFEDEDVFYSIYDAYEKLETFDIDLIKNEKLKQSLMVDWTNLWDNIIYAYKIPSSGDKKFKEWFIKFKDLDDVLDYYQKKWNMFND